MSRNVVFLRPLCRACVEVCPTACLHFGDLADPNSTVSRLLETRKHKVLHPETGCDPRVYFLV